MTQRDRLVSYEGLLAGHVLPVVRFRRTALGEYEPIAAMGSGFTFGEGTFVTCWHCVSVPAGEDEVYGAAMRSEGTGSQKYDEVFDQTATAPAPARSRSASGPS